MRYAITFVHAPVVTYDQNYGTRFAPLWAYTLAAYVPDDWQVTIAEGASATPSALQGADVFAFSGINQDLPSILAVQRQLKVKYPSARFIVGGPLTWSFEQEGRLELLDSFDFVFLLDGEETLPRFLNALANDNLSALPRTIRAERFDLAAARSIRFSDYRKNFKHYYGAVIEVSRGCPFLCEFCDIRVVPGNNRANNKPVALILQEMDEYLALGVTQFLFVCDNFIGNPAWARECAEAIIAWRERHPARISIFTWLTINLYKLPDLMGLLRRAGFSILYIGIESVNQNALLETAKVQNRVDLTKAVSKIQGYGFVIAPGLIFGFDSDTEAVFRDTLEFIIESGLIGGDPSFLSALPGTPLFERMKRTGRLVEPPGVATERRKVSTNIRYLQPRAALSEGFLWFMSELNGAQAQLARFRQHLALLTASEDFVPSGGEGYGSPSQYLRLQFADATNRQMLVARLSFLAKPQNALAAARGFLLWRRAEKERPGLGVHFYFWLYFWTNLALKYRHLRAEDLDLHSATEGTNLADLARDAAQALVHADGLVKRHSKAQQQARHTSLALQRLADADVSPEGQSGLAR